MNSCTTTDHPPGCEGMCPPSGLWAPWSPCAAISGPEATEVTCLEREAEGLLSLFYRLGATGHLHSAFLAILRWDAGGNWSVYKLEQATDTSVHISTLSGPSWPPPCVCVHSSTPQPLSINTQCWIFTIVDCGVFVMYMSHGAVLSRLCTYWLCQIPVRHVWKMRVLSSLFCFIFIPSVKSRCSLSSRNPYWTGGPRVDQVTLTSVKVSWDGLLENSDCADSLRIKYWWANAPNNYQLSEKLPVSSTNFVIGDLLKYQEYAFQVAAIEDQTILRSVDWNRSPITSFTTSDNPEVTTS